MIMIPADTQNPPKYRFANDHPNNVPPPKPLLGLAGLKRNGPHHSSGSSTVDSTVKSVNQLLDHSLTKRRILGRAGYFDDDEVVAYIDAVAEQDQRSDLGALGGLNGLGDLSGLGGGTRGSSLGGLGGLGLKKRNLGGLEDVTGLVRGKKAGKGQSAGSLGGLTGLLG